jgi:hypothetical protein
MNTRYVSLRRTTVATMAVLGLMCGLSAAPAHASPAGTGKGAPPLPAIGEYDQVAAPPPTGEVADRAARKNADNAQRFAAIQQQWAARAQGATAVEPDTVPTAKTLGVSYQIQTTSYWCGPTTLAVILGYKGLGWGGSAHDQQQAAANLLGTTTDGTNWYGQDNVPNYPGTSWYPMQDALNYKLYVHGNSFRYDVMAVPGAPSASDQSNYKANLVVDIADYSFPFAANEYAAPGYQIGKQPSGQWIMHWIAPNGYSGSGSTTVFEDPGWGGGSASSALSSKVVVAVGGRGYIV